MKIVTFINEESDSDGRTPRIGALLNDGADILDFARAIRRTDHEAQNGASQIPPASSLEWFDLEGAWWPPAQAAYRRVVEHQTSLDEAREAGMLVKRSRARLLAPVPRPGKLICIGLNYRDHAAESKMPIPSSPVVFSKFTSSIIGPGEPVIVPPTSQQVDYEAELAVVMGRRAKHAPRERALDYVLGYTMVNDVSARDFQFADGQWQRGKSCDTFAPMGESIVTTDEVPDPHRLTIKLHLNGHTMQDSTTDQLIFGVPELIAFLSQTITLEPGDVIATGTPPGVGFARQPPVFIKHGDVMEVEIEKLGKLTNPVRAAAETVH